MEIFNEKANSISFDRRDRSRTPLPPKSATPKFLPSIKRKHKSTERPSKHKSDKKEKNSISREESASIGLKYYRLPSNYPKHFDTFSEYTNKEGKQIPLLHRGIVVKTLYNLHRDVQPIVNKFNLHYAALSENHPTKGKAAFTNRIPLKFFGPNAHAHHILIRIRHPSSPNDPKKFYNKSTLLAILFHELAHIRHMDHKQDFMLLIRDIYSYANRINLFPKDEEHQMPSCREWEKLIYNFKGRVSDEVLNDLYKSNDASFTN
ncbi:unnamed protein product [Blepharisma stoltei]|uniref:WLM domain-containing protein n=1 Tax=Blepharisma stoltei TaxID=1481888 RepID=A0AAU9ITE9_9CILI|nr:unnamed protein product [Blepharisma stoltei]